MDGRRLPCPDRIVDMVGSAFGVGCVGSFGVTFVGGLRNNPRGHRLSGAFASARARAPMVGGTFALWSLLFHSFECAVSMRHPGDTDHRSSVDGALCGFLTAGLLTVRYGARAASTNALMGGSMVAFIDFVTGTASWAASPGHKS
uniref:Mitochondrial import inner membrane translocase subunit TIM22 n=1 Tax=Noctiluca scintillans TaxID=2966 RepID=A0A7S1AI36_NOCSC